MIQNQSGQETVSATLARTRRGTLGPHPATYVCPRCCCGKFSVSCCREFPWDTPLRHPWPPLDAHCGTLWQTWDIPQHYEPPCAKWWAHLRPDPQLSQMASDLVWKWGTAIKGHLNTVLRCKNRLVCSGDVHCLACTRLTNKVAASLIIQAVMSHLATKSEYIDQKLIDTSKRLLAHAWMATLTRRTGCTFLSGSNFFAQGNFHPVCQAAA